MFNLFFVLIVAIVAFFIWEVAKHKYLKKTFYKFKLSRDYLVGLNYLLNEQEDEALEVFIKLLEVDRNTVETHLALGSIFRRKGEVDRAIRIHQNLIARPQLTDTQRLDALMALGHDYLMAGLLDRSERIFLDLLQAKNEHKIQALKALLDIYQQEKEWRKSIQIAKKIQDVTKESMNNIISHHYCELSEICLEDNDLKSAKKYLSSALNMNNSSVRANLLEAKCFMRENQYKKALKYLKKASDANIDFRSETLPYILECYEKLDKKKDGYLHIQKLQQITPQDGTLMVLFDILQNKTSAIDIEYLQTELHKSPSITGLVRLIDIYANDTSIDRENNIALQSLAKIATKLIDDEINYRCTHCGYSSHALVWHCPSCKKWDTVAPKVI